MSKKTNENKAHRGHNVKMVFLPSSTESRRGHTTMKTKQISNAHAPYGKTTSGRPSSSLPSWILRSLLRGNDAERMIDLSLWNLVFTSEIKRTNVGNLNIIPQIKWTNFRNQMDKTKIQNCDSLPTSSAKTLGWRGGRE